MSNLNSSIDLLSLILVLYFFVYVFHAVASLFQSEKELIGKVSAKRAGFLNLFYWATIEHDGSRIELSIKEAQIGLMSEGDIVKVYYKGRRILDFDVLKSKYENL